MLLYFILFKKYLFENKVEDDIFFNGIVNVFVIFDWLFFIRGLIFVVELIRKVCFGDEFLLVIFFVVLIEFIIFW